MTPLSLLLFDFIFFFFDDSLSTYNTASSLLYILDNRVIVGVVDYYQWDTSYVSWQIANPIRNTLSMGRVDDLHL